MEEQEMEQKHKKRMFIINLSNELSYALTYINKKKKIKKKDHVRERYTAQNES